MTGRTAGETIVEHRQQTTPKGEPIIEDTRKLGTEGKADAPSVKVNVATEACDIIGFPRGKDAQGTVVKIEIYHDRYVVRPIQE